MPLNGMNNYNTRSSRYNFLVLHCRGVDNSTFYYRGIIDWNSIPEWLKEVENPHRFKIALKKFLIEQHHENELDDFFYTIDPKYHQLSCISWLACVT